MDERSLIVTVAELLITPTLKNLKLISGFYGVHREISTVTVIDTPDGFQWLTGNEVVITTTYALEKDRRSFLQFYHFYYCKRSKCSNCKNGSLFKSYS